MSFEERGKVFREVSPIYHMMSRDKVARDCGTLPTVLLYHCEDDSTVPASHSKDFHATLIDADRGSKRNLVCTLALDKKGGHAGVMVEAIRGEKEEGAKLATLVNCAFN